MTEIDIKTKNLTNMKGPSNKTIKNRARRKKQRMKKKNKNLQVVVSNKSNKIPRQMNNNGTKQETLINMIRGKPIYNYLEALTNPFSPNATGALRPDGTNMPTTPLKDRIAFGIDPSGFAYTGNSLNSYETQITIEQVIITYLPRCFAAGWGYGTGLNLAPADPMISTLNPKDIKLHVPYSYSTSESVEDLSEKVFITEPYVLCVLMVTTGGRAVRLPSSEEEKVQSYGDWPVGPTFVQFARTTYANQCAGIRINGAGLKILPLGAPINTGGIIYSGTISQEVLYQSCISNQTTSAFANYETKIRNRSRFKGVEGVTIRYDPVQTKVHHQFKDGFTDDDYYSTTRVYDQTDLLSQQDNNKFSPGRRIKREMIEEKEPYIEIQRGKNVGKKATKVNALDASAEDYVRMYWNTASQIEDLCGKDDQVPIVIWRFDKSQGAETTVTDYNIQIEAVCHAEMIPKGNSPFVSEKVPEQPGLASFEKLTTNYELIPLSQKGSSFKTIMRHFANFAGRVPMLADSASKIAKIIESTVNSFL
jgi:hypothetical protein